RNISQHAKSPHKHLKKDIYKYFPPRNKWIRLNKLERSKRNSNSVETNSIQLERTIWREIKECKKKNLPQPEWLKNLLEFTNSIREAALDDSNGYAVTTPKTVPVLKEKKQSSYRPISIFKLKDLIVTGQVSKYLST